MAKAGFWLRGAQGTLAGSVLSPSPQGTVVREKVTPSNPQTEKQVTQRSKFKLVSQLASQLADTIAIPRSNGLTARNQFVKRNFPLVSAASGNATITLPNVQLTMSNRGMAQLHAERTFSGSEVVSSKVYVDTENAENLSRVVYAVYVKNAEGSLIYVDSKVVEAGESANFETEISLPNSGDCVVYAYGAKDTGSKATAKYGNLKVQNAIDFASLIFNRTISTTDMYLTQTRGVELRTGDTESLYVPEGYVAAYASFVPAETGEVKFTDGEGHEVSQVQKMGSELNIEFNANKGYLLDSIYSNGELQEKFSDNRKAYAEWWGEVNKTIDLLMYTKQYNILLATRAYTYSISDKVDVIGLNPLLASLQRSYQEGSQVAVQTNQTIELNGTQYKFKFFTIDFDPEEDPNLPTEDQIISESASFLMDIEGGDLVANLPSNIVLCAWYEPAE